MLTNFYTYICFYIFIVLSTMGYGLAISSISKKFKITNNLGYIGLIGLLFLIIYSYLSNIFIAHGKIHNLIILIIGLIFFIKLSYANFKKNDWNYFFIIFFILLIGAFILKTHDDFSYYHFGYSHYLTENSIIIGIGQLNLGYRTPSSIFYLNSLFYLPYVEYFMFHMPAIMVLGFSNLILLIKLRENIIKNKVNFVTYFALLVFIFINIFFYRISEHGTDKSAQILVFLLFIEIFLLTNFKINISNQISKIYILIALIISLKAFYILYCIFLIVVMHYLFINFSLKKMLKILFYNPFFIFLFSTFILIIFNNFAASGCLIYPVTFTCFEQPIWAIKIQEVIVLNDWYEQWAKAGAGPNYRVENPSEYIENFNWVYNWFEKYFFNKVSDYLLATLLLTTIIFYSFRSNTIIKFKEKKISLILFLIFILLFEWFYNHPALRYGGYCLISSIYFIFLSLYLEKFKFDKKKLINKILVFVALAILIFIGRNINRILYEVKIYDYQPIKKTYYNVDPVYFGTSDTIRILIKQYEDCMASKKDCYSDNNHRLKKIFGKYVIYNNND